MSIENDLRSIASTAENMAEYARELIIHLRLVDLYGTAVPLTELDSLVDLISEQSTWNGDYVRHMQKVYPKRKRQVREILDFAEEERNVD